MLLKIFINYLLINCVHSISKHPILIIISYDAFRYNFFETQNLPRMVQLRNAGTYADFLINVFPTKTFPNHHSIATGLYPDIHGVIDNNFYDTKTQTTINITNEQMYHFNDRVVPIWRLNEDCGDGRYSGVMMWPGGHYNYQNKSVTYSKLFEMNYDWYKRIDIVISWIMNRDKPANLVMVYFEEPDTHGHAFGPDSPIVGDLLKKLDNITQYLQDKLIENNIKDKVNVIHLSDHGMIGVTPPHFINITQYLTPDTYKYAGSSPGIHIIPKQGYEDEIYNKLKKASVGNHFKVYRKSEYLDRWHFRDNPRSPPILVMADVGYALDDLIIASSNYAHKYKFNVTNQTEFGVHGYDYTVKDMHPFFMARGPKIRQQNKIAPFCTVDLFNLFCEILEIPAVGNNGSLANIKDILIHSNGKYTLSSILIVTVGGIIIAILLIGCAAFTTLIMIKRQQSITTTAALNKRFPQTFQTTVEAQHLLEPEDA